LGRLRVAADRTLRDHAFDQDRTNQGQIAGMPYREKAFVDLITWPGALAVLHQLGFVDCRYWSGFAIAKEFGEPPLYWHQDWVFWDEPETCDPLPHQIFLMYYLSDTRVENGCLRVIPQSHRRRFDLHDHLGKGHDSDVRTQDDYSHPVFSRHADEIDVPVKAGDVVIGDARLLHSANANQTHQRRTVLTLWYLPRYAETSARVQAGYCARTNTAALDGLAVEELDRLRPLLPTCQDGVEAAVWNRVPGALLRA
jgi:ectoine hydroxylase-related dioxygenase (phytanoyl-CoA dioxygenase family)